MSPENPLNKNRSKSADEVEQEEILKAGVANEGQESFKDLPQMGDRVVATKKFILEGAQSDFKPGFPWEGDLIFPIAVGQPLFVGDLETSPVKVITRGEKGKYIVQTQTSTYEVAMATPFVRQEQPVNAIENGTTEVPFESLEETREKFPDLPQEFDKVFLIKESLQEGAESSVEVGRREEAVFFGNVQEGQIIATSKVQTSRIKRGGISRIGDGKFRIETATSTYVLEKAV